MRRRRLLLGAGALAPLALAGVSAIFLLSRDPVTPANCDRIEVGMTAAEVEAILGRPADLSGANYMAQVPGSEAREEWVWLGQEWVIFVHYDDRGAVCNKGCAAEAAGFRVLGLASPTLWDRLRRLVPW